MLQDCWMSERRGQCVTQQDGGAGMCWDRHCLSERPVLTPSAGKLFTSFGTYWMKPHLFSLWAGCLCYSRPKFFPTEVIKLCPLILSLTWFSPSRKIRLVLGRVAWSLRDVPALISLKEHLGTHHLRTRAYRRGVLLTFAPNISGFVVPWGSLSLSCVYLCLLLQKHKFPGSSPLLGNSSFPNRHN